MKQLVFALSCLLSCNIMAGSNEPDNEPVAATGTKTDTLVCKTVDPSGTPTYFRCADNADPVTVVDRKINVTSKQKADPPTIPVADRKHPLELLAPPKGSPEPDDDITTLTDSTGSETGSEDNNDENGRGGDPGEEKTGSPRSRDDSETSSPDATDPDAIE